jgi:SOS regulatory protein LexA
MDAKEFGKYIKMLRIKKGYKSQRQLAEASGISNGTIARIENGTQKPTVDTLKILSKFLDTDYVDLLLKAGYLPESYINESKDKLPTQGEMQLIWDHAIEHKTEHKIKYENEYIPTVKVPVLGHIAAGRPIFADEHIIEWREIPNLWNLREGEVFMLRVKGDSMIGSRIYDGDLVVVRCQPDVENGEIAVVNVNGDEATLKRVKKTENGQIILYPDNPKYDPIFIDSENARIVGKVIQVMFEPKKIF